MSRLSASCGSAALVVALMYPRAARAQGAQDAAHEKASSSFQEGRRLIDQGNCEAAVAKLRESLQYESSVGARLSIADCIEKSDPLQAWRVLKEAAVLAFVNHDDRLALAEQHASTLQSQGRLAMLQFKLPAGSDRAGFELRVDGEVVDRYFYRGGYAVTPGRHSIDANASGRRFSGELSVDAGGTTVVNVELRADDCPPGGGASLGRVGAPSPELPSDRGSSRRALGLAVGGIGVVGLASGVAFGLLTLDKKHAIQAACGGNVGSCSAAHGSLDAEDEAAKTTAALSTFGFIAGGVGLLAGAAIYLTAPSASVYPPTRVGVRMSPRASRSGGGLALEGTW